MGLERIFDCSDDPLTFKNQVKSLFVPGSITYTIAKIEGWFGFEPNVPQGYYDAVEPSSNMGLAIGFDLMKVGVYGMAIYGTMEILM